MSDDTDLAGAAITIASIPPVLVDRDGLALLLGVSARTVSRFDDSGRIPAALPLGGCKRWSVDEIKSWAAAGGPPRSEWNGMRERAP